MQAPETQALGDAIGFGSAFLFSAVFGMQNDMFFKMLELNYMLVLSYVRFQQQKLILITQCRHTVSCHREASSCWPSARSLGFSLSYLRFSLSSK